MNRAVVAVVTGAFLLAGCSSNDPKAAPEPDRTDPCDQAVGNWFEAGKKRTAPGDPVPESFKITGRTEDGQARTCAITITYEGDARPFDWIAAVAERPGGVWEVYDGWESPDSGTPKERAQRAVEDAKAVNALLNAYRKKTGKVAKQVVLTGHEDRSFQLSLSDGFSHQLRPGNMVVGYSPKAKTLCVVHESGPWAELNRSTGQVKSEVDGTCP